MERDQETETIELTDGIFQALLNMTGGDVELHTPKRRRLVKALHAAVRSGNARWLVTFTEEDVESAYTHLEGYCLNRPTKRTRIMNHMCRQSQTFHGILSRAEGQNEDASREEDSQ